MIKKFIIGLIFTTLLIVPLVANGNLYYLGGDDMRLYYVYPEKYLENYVFNLIGGNTLAGANTGYATVAYYAPMFYFIKFLKLIPLNTQFLMFGLNLSLGFLFFYKFLGLYNNKGYLEKIVGSVFYMLSPFLLATFYKNQLLSMYLISVIPACLYFFISGVRENKYYLTFAGVSIFSLFSTIINTLPWWSAFLIPTSVLLFYEFWNYKKNFAFQFVFAFVLFVSINSYWLIDFIKWYITPTGIIGESVDYNSTAFLADNLRVMQGVATIFNPTNILFVNLNSHLNTASLINGVYMLLVIAPFLFLNNRIKKVKKMQYIIFIFMFLLSWYLFSPNITSYGPKIMLFITQKIPLLGMYRNMFDKFSLVLAFSFALSLSFSLYLLKEVITKKTFIFINIILLSLTIYNAKDLLLFKYTNDQELYRVSGELNKEYLHLITDIKAIPDSSKVVWLPLNYPSYSIIEDQNNRGHYYVGLSPMRILADRSDYTGGFSFITQTDTFADQKIWTLLESRKYEDVGKVLRKMGARYVILDKQVYPEVIKSYLFGGEDLKLLGYQGDDFLEEVLGKKMREYGERYVMYEINEKYLSRQIYLTGYENGMYENSEYLVYEKVNNNEYKIQISNKNDGYLVFLESYDKNWKLLRNNNPVSVTHKDVLGYANIWDLRKINLQEGDVLAIKFED